MTHGALAALLHRGLHRPPEVVRRNDESRRRTSAYRSTRRPFDPTMAAICDEGPPSAADRLVPARARRMRGSLRRSAASSPSTTRHEPQSRAASATRSCGAVGIRDRVALRRSADSCAASSRISARVGGFSRTSATAVRRADVEIERVGIALTERHGEPYVASNVRVQRWASGAAAARCRREQRRPRIAGRRRSARKRHIDEVWLSAATV